jgi:hypothetical protein
VRQSDRHYRRQLGLIDHLERVVHKVFCAVVACGLFGFAMSLQVEGKGAAVTRGEWKQVAENCAVGAPAGQE